MRHKFNSRPLRIQTMAITWWLRIQVKVISNTKIILAYTINGAKLTNTSSIIYTGLKRIKQD